MTMDELGQFLNGVEASARRILKQQNRKAQELAVRDRAALTRASKAGVSATPTTTSSSNTNTTPSSVSRDELKARYTPGGALVVSAPVAPLPPTPGSPLAGRRSETDEPLPRLDATASSPSKANASTRSSANAKDLRLPSLDRAKHKKHAKPTRKLLESPLYQSLQRGRANGDGDGGDGGGSGAGMRRTLQDADQVTVLLRRLGLRDHLASSSPAARADHAVEKRMCHACWSSPDRSTGCEHHPRVLPANGGGRAELQGPTSWLSDDLFAKFRSEPDREALWTAATAMQLNEQQQHEGVVVQVNVERHPVVAKFAALLELENLRVLAETRRRNLRRTFVFDVDSLWLTNLDHFNSVQSRADEGVALADRRDERAIREGRSQIPSVSAERALTHAIQSAAPASRPATASTEPLQVSDTSRKRRRRELREPPLSLRVCERWATPEALEQALRRVPGVAVVGERPVLWWRSPSEDGDDAVEWTRTAAVFSRSAALSSSRAVVVALVTALDAPVAAPRAFAWRLGSRSPPPSIDGVLDTESESLAPPALAAPRSAALSAQALCTRVDEVLPPTIALLNAFPSAEDHQLDANRSSAHRREWPLFEPRDAMRCVLALAPPLSLAPQFDVPVRECGLQAALPNAAGVGGRTTWHATAATVDELCRRRDARDLLAIACSHESSGAGDATSFYAALRHEALADVVGARLAQFLARQSERRRREQHEREALELERKLAAGRVLLEAKRQEQLELERRLQLAAARADDRLAGHSDTNDEQLAAEWAARMAQSTVTDVQRGWERRELEGGVAFFAASNEALPARHRFAWRPPPTWTDQADPQDQDDDYDDSDEGDEDRAALAERHEENERGLARLARELLSDAGFLSLLRDRLGLPAATTRPTTSSTQTTDTGEQDDDDGDLLARLGLEGPVDEAAVGDAAQHGAMAARMARLRVPLAADVKQRRPGEGWKRLKETRLARGFARSVYATRVERPRSAFVDRPNAPTPVGMLDPAAWGAYEPREFVPELRVLLVAKAGADLREKQAQWAALHDERAATASAMPRAPTRDRSRLEDDESEPMESRVARAVLCARNNNMEGVRGPRLRVMVA